MGITTTVQLVKELELGDAESYVHDSGVTGIHSAASGASDSAPRHSSYRAYPGAKERLVITLR